jgi:hypothetical protein
MEHEKYVTTLYITEKIKGKTWVQRRIKLTKQNHNGEHLSCRLDKYMDKCTGSRYKIRQK